MSFFPPELLAESLGDFNVTDEIEAWVNTLARRARSDPEARNALYQALGTKIERFVRRCCYRRGINELTPCQPDDVWQEAFLVLSELVQQWPGGGSFTGFFLSIFPRRLSRAVDMLERGCTLSAETQRQMLESLARDNFGLALEDEYLLAEIGDCLNPRERLVLELYIVHGLTHRQIGRILGLHIRTVVRIWQQILEALRRAWVYPAPELDTPDQACPNRRNSTGQPVPRARRRRTKRLRARPHPRPLP